MNDLKKLYVLLAILIVIYVGINFSYNGLDTINTLTHVNLDLGPSMDNANDANHIKIGSSSFTKLENFTVNRINEKEVRLVDSKNQISIKVCELPDSRNLKNKVKDLLETDKNITSNQTISQNGITAYFLYKETPESYSADINFMKNHKNYYISASNVSYNKSDYFINNSKEIINSMQSNGNINYNRF